ncbi:uncharacterized protein [Gossypium hirsutum]|uniref:RNase H type-1 domain-containing protein n=1 Tax=Gossypium hirsutum TaxID=3635 RepID=A0ABM2ZI46_GOSHI|nr:uncharacterized protein LOC121213606 [Gossypium hirsutum]
MYVAIAEEDSQKNHHWKLNFDRASNAVGNGIGAVLVSPNGYHYPFTSKLDFDCTNNMAEYETCIMGIRAAIERKIKILELKGEWEKRDPKLIHYQKLVLELIEEFDSITFRYLPQDENQMVDALATLASMIKVNKSEDMKSIQISIYETPAPCYKNDKRTLRRLTIDYVLDGEILYNRGKDQVLLRYVDAVEAKKILEEVHEVYKIEAILPIEVEISSLRVLAELKLDEAEWIQFRYDKLNLIEEKRLKVIHHGQMY